MAASGSVIGLLWQEYPIAIPSQHNCINRLNDEFACISVIFNDFKCNLMQFDAAKWIAGSIKQVQFALNAIR